MSPHGGHSGGVAMISRCLLLFAFAHASLAGQGTESRLRLGDDALSSGLWEIAALHFQDALGAADLAAADRPRVALRLAQAWIREGKAAEALALLDESFVSNQPETAFWKGMALAAAGRLGEAATLLDAVGRDAAAPQRREAVFTTANLLLALGNPEQALATLGSLAGSPDIALAAKARLHQAEILLDLGRPDEARAAMPEAAMIAPDDRPLATLLAGRLDLAAGRVKEATAAFESLVNQPRGQSSRQYHLAALALADALLAGTDTAAAARFLITFIRAHPDSPQLDALFQRLDRTLAESPAPADPTLDALASWITPAELPTMGLIANADSSAAAAWPVVRQPDELLPHALFTRAQALLRTGTPTARDEARLLLDRLRLENPQHPLADRALFLIARMAIAAGDTDRAFGILGTLKENARLPQLRGEAAFLEARNASDRSDPEAAARLFDEAAASLDQRRAAIAGFNAALLRLGQATMPVLQPALAADPARVADLELERALVQTDPAAQRAAIEEFLLRHPAHPRTAEARLAAAEAALATPIPDLSFARAQVETLSAAAPPPADIAPLRLALVRLRIEDLAGNATAAITAARGILEQFPADPAAAEAALILGRNLFQTRSYNDARLVLEKLAASDARTARAEAAWLLAARSAALVPTSQSQQEALILFDKVTELKGPLSPVAKLEKARLMIDMNRIPEAAAFLRTWFATLPAADPLHLPAGLLLGEAIYAQGSANPDSLAEALAVYDRLLAGTDAYSALYNRLQYLRGRVLEQLPDPANPARKRDPLAFAAYYSVLEAAPPPAEWHYFELCGFRALALLEKAGRWPAAIACARKISSFNGPRAQEASNRASQLQLQHMIWED